jgi:DNA replication and repair protein RecF
MQEKKGFYLSQLYCQNFRNLNSEQMSFQPGINCIFGSNGNGKTNILEAIYLLTNKKSFRKNTQYGQLVNLEETSTDIILMSAFSNEENELQSVSFKLPESGRSSWSLNGKPARGHGLTKSVFINPFDAFSFHSTALFRRSWIDQHLGFLDLEYVEIRKKYSQLLKFKNKLLQEKPYKWNIQINALHENIARLSFIIREKRNLFISKLSPYLQQNFKNIFNESFSLQIRVQSKWNNLNEQEILKKLVENTPKEAAACRTLYGPHLDDFIPFMNEMNALDYASLGQQKTAYLSLIFAYIELFRYKFTSYPIVLIDDVSGELDSVRWLQLIKHLGSQAYQVFITTANEKFSYGLSELAKTSNYEVEEGKLKTIAAPIISNSNKNNSYEFESLGV